jgi:hypothetical protein
MALCSSALSSLSWKLSMEGLWGEGQSPGGSMATRWRAPGVLRRCRVPWALEDWACRLDRWTSHSFLTASISFFW